MVGGMLNHAAYLHSFSCMKNSSPRKLNPDDWIRSHMIETWLTTHCSDKSLKKLTKALFGTLFSRHILPSICRQVQSNEKIGRMLILMLTGRGLATPIWTVPRLAPFRAWTASSRLAFSKLVSLTYMSRSPGNSLPSCSATPLGTRERITITVLAGSSGSCGGADPVKFGKKR